MPAGLDELGESMTEAQYGELVAALTKYNVALTDINGEFRSTYDIVADIAAIWNELSTMEQAALANACGKEVGSMVETTVGKIRVGTKLLLGQYGVSADEIFPIMWLKATPNGDFIAAKVLDYICFDGRERQSADYNMRMFGNPDYGRSNILQFLNSQDESWWNPTHESDSPPDRSNVCNINDAYHDHCGFLYNFEEYEIDSLVRKLIHTPSGVRESLMRLPSYSDLVGDDRFQLFSRRGIRANGSEDYILRRGLYANFDTGSYVEFWLSDLYNNGDYKAVLSRNGEMGYKHPYHSAGLRPVCTLKPDTVLEMDENGFCWVKQVGGQDKLFTNDEFFELLGVARP